MLFELAALGSRAIVAPRVVRNFDHGGYRRYQQLQAPEPRPFVHKWTRRNWSPDNRSYSGMLSCFFQGLVSCLPLRFFNARTIRRRVPWGMITSSM